ncbi:Zinc finger protein 426 [Amphibalanus amphitrite]|uniref:Zinc finger protein 426 n=1 Tax=Amphibalanus amphitrite TaxID=1232801 RepID=A0A6A4WJW9_AMPAM|nr:Zinc finger protein 426 [Amphibalanus amphitrite]
MVVRKVDNGDTAKPEYECRECQKRFTTFSHWKYHISCRTGKARYRSSQCSWTGNVKQHYNYHMDRHKGVTPTHVCKVCSAKFLQKSTLDRHMATHSTEGGLQCAQCLTRFTCQYNYQRHLRTHTGEKPFVCQLCQKAFSDQGNLKKHMLKHTAGAEERCPVCPEPKLYRTPATLAQHLRECHDLPRPAQRHSCPAPGCWQSTSLAARTCAGTSVFTPQLTHYQNHLRQLIGDAAFEGLSTMFDNLRNNVVACMSARHQDKDGRVSRPS